MLNNQSIILIVDDTPANIQILSDLLTDYKKKVAINGKIALKLAEADPKPDIILLDVMMPIMDGFEVCEKLKANPETKDIPVIFITAKNSIEDETKGLKLGAVDFIAKPISPPSVLARVKNHLELKHARQKLEESNILLEEKNVYITDSIRYAEHIQSSILKSDEELKKMFSDCYLIFRPKDIVSGDFYWFAEFNDTRIIASVDCTGHGVPGAFMSMIGNSKLNEIIYEKEIVDPAEILNILNQSIIDELNKESNSSLYDGMDIALCAISSDEIIFSGAYRPLYYVQNGKLHILKGAKKSIGEMKKKTSFINHKIQLTNDLILFLFSDGIVDQNNSDNKKFGTRFLKEILTSNIDKPVQAIGVEIEDKLDKFQGDEIQRDDVTFLIVKP